MKSRSEFLFCDYMTKRQDGILADPTLPLPRPKLTPAFRAELRKAALTAQRREREDQFVFDRAVMKMIMGHLTPQEVLKGGVSI